MNLRGAILNPIRFYEEGVTVDNITVFPNIDNVAYDDSYQYGVASSPDTIRTHVGDMHLQFVNKFNTVQTFSAYKLNSENVFESIGGGIDSVDISPVGWVGYQIHKVTLTGLADGYYYLFDPDSLAKSDVFRITSSSIVSEDLIKIKYSNSINDFGCIFGTNYFEAYFRGRVIPGESKIDLDTYEDDRSQPVKLKASPQRAATLSILGLNYLYKDLIDHIFSCDTIEVNGVQYENVDAPNYDNIEGANICNVTIKLIQSINDYYYGD